MSTLEITGKALEWRKLQTMIRELEAQAEAIKAAITAEMDARRTDTMQADIFTIRWTVYTSSRLDATALKRELPDVAARYTRTTEARRFQIA